ncbi:hypothetical protein FJR11_10440 [Anabaena sp. UHCC 0187]|uniref:hypothetical protein n=1 Tax=Anabaena sp. UHCC 0187 TaxID=2590018 RepID=UPI001445E148|nr:hypothetical protein [Anabaena sp. UHCC 0187]MDP5016177.1 hypothetical protein [Dolichospermum sp.]MTJ13001.1 hypothetical protein [Anabaena sp. UHCC 0187]
MSDQNIKSDLLEELSTEEQQLLSGGHWGGPWHRGGGHCGPRCGGGGNWGGSGPWHGGGGGWRPRRRW